MLTSNNTTEAGASRPPTEAAVAEFKAGKRQVAPPHPGRLIAHTLDDIGVSQRQAALAMGVTPQSFGDVINGNAAITTKMAMRLGRFFGNGPELWLNLQRDYDVWHAADVMKDDLAKMKTAAEIAKRG